MKREIYLIAHDMRSTHNVGSLLRTADGIGVAKIYLTGYTPYPTTSSDERLPHIAAKLTAQIEKTALGATQSVPWEYCPDIYKVLNTLSSQHIPVVALEQTEKATPLPAFQAPQKIALILGTEVTGIPNEILEHIDTHIVIPMYGKKESYNVVQAAAMALYHLRFHS